ncbi:MAG: RDD family protein [Xanthomonadaceae bacterium]|jgi:uncharacterized RDD family membrane protein YckC|nr:RDD family protein [Xanthomonadaceae bacterium]
MSNWYYADIDRQQHGPLPPSLIGDRFRAGEISMETLVWCDGMPEWRPLREFADEFALIPVTQPPLSAKPEQAGAAETPVADSGEYTPYAAPIAALSGDIAPVTGGEIVYAGFWKRVAAYCVDSVVIWVISTVINTIVMIVMIALMAGGTRTSETTVLIFQMVMYLISTLLTAAYYASFHSSQGKATLGKMAVGIKVVRSDGSRISLARGVGRYFATILSSLIFCIGFIMAAFTQRKQALHDMICDTLVVDKWAFTNHPEWQKRELGTVATIILVLFAIMVVIFVFVMFFLLAAIGISAANL